MKLEITKRITPKELGHHFVPFAGPLSTVLPIGLCSHRHSASSVIWAKRNVAHVKGRELTEERNGERTFAKRCALYLSREGNSSACAELMSEVVGQELVTAFIDFMRAG